MNGDGMLSNLKYALALIGASLLVACGGGGGSAGVTTGSSAPKPAGIAVVVKSSSGATVTSVSIGGGQQVSATVLDGAGKAVSGKLVTFSVEPTSIAVLTPTSALTNASGVATVSISPSSINAQGAGTVKAEASVDSAQVTGSVDFAVQNPSLTLSPIQLGASTLSSGGNTQISATALIDGRPASGLPVSVVFTASCGVINERDAVAGVTALTDGAGLASVSYRAVSSTGELCRGVVAVSAAISGAGSQATSLTVSPPTANSVAFVSSTPSQIYVAGAGAAEQSTVKFRVSAGVTPLSNVQVRFSISVNPGGVSIGTQGNAAAVTATTDSLGEASVVLFSGTIPGPVKVRAELASNSSIFSESQNLTVASGPPSQRFMSLAAETSNIEGWNRDGTSSRLSIRVADRQGNPVENGTVVNLTAEGGQVQPSCATQIVDGISLCTVNFVSQNPRPAGGRVSILAFVSGTKDYDDVNQNNRYDAGVDTLINQGDAYRDDNENGVYDGTEFVVPRGGSLACSGSGSPFPSRANTCDALLATTVRQQTVILFSSSNPVINVSSITAAGVNFTLGSLHNPLLPMPAGTTVTAEAADATANGLECSVDKVFGSPVPNVTPGVDSGADLNTAHSISLKDCSGGDSVVITITAPSGLKTSFTRTIPTNSVPPGPANVISTEAVTPSQIFVSGNGLAEQATVSFVVRSGTTPKAGEQVRLSIVNNVGGIQIGSRGSGGPLVLTTDASGRVSTTIFSGTVPTPVRLRAELVSAPTVFAETQNLSISSGPPSQRFFSLSASTYNLEGWNGDGTPTTLTIYAADRQGNPVPAGTEINFTAEGGQISRSCATTLSNGIASCSVTFVSQSPRPADGRVAILAYAEGTKDYLDANGNNTFDAGDILTNIGDAYRDDNEDNSYTSGEFLVSRNASGGTCAASQGAPEPARASTCDSTLLTTVRRQMNLMLGGANARIIALNSLGNEIVQPVPPALPQTTSASQFRFRVNSLGPTPQNLPMPAGSTVAVTSLTSTCTVDGVFPASVPNIGGGIVANAQLGSVHSASFSGSGCVSGNLVRVLVTTPSGVVTGEVFELP